MKRKYFLLLIILFLSFVSSYACFAAEKINPSDAEKWANSKGEQILRILADKNLERKYKELDAIFYKDIDLDNAAKFVCGKYWKKMTMAQRQKYVPLFKRYMSSIYKSYPLDFGSDSIGFKVQKVLPTKTGADVWCLIKLKKIMNSTDAKNESGFNVLFSLTKNNGQIQVKDLKICESSLLVVMRNRFYKMIYEDNDEELDWFLEDLETITKDNEQKNEQNLENSAF